MHVMRCDAHGKRETSGEDQEVGDNDELLEERKLSESTTEVNLTAANEYDQLKFKNIVAKLAASGVPELECIIPKAKAF